MNKINIISGIIGISLVLTSCNQQLTNQYTPTKNNQKTEQQKEIIFNQTYFKGITVISFKEMNNNLCAEFEFDKGIITLNYNQTGCGDLSYTILHELKHNYCKTYFPDELKECRKQYFKDKNENEFSDCIHKGCFENTPIDKEYGYVN